MFTLYNAYPYIGLPRTLNRFNDQRFLPGFGLGFGLPGIGLGLGFLGGLATGALLTPGPGFGYKYPPYPYYPPYPPYQYPYPYPYSQYPNYNIPFSPY
ncbi:hypothetical protein [Ferdinandcohnia sp. Marseille-Q9671]